MKNKVKLKKCLLLIGIISLVFLAFFLLLNIYEYQKYTVNFNHKISAILSKVEEEYPSVSENELMEIVNSETTNYAIFSRYNIDLNTDSLILENNNIYPKFVLWNILLFALAIGSVIGIFLRYNKSKDKEINGITKYIEEINKKNYKLCIDEISEDELSILKNEIYKTTIMLKEQAENSMNDKRKIKESLSDISHQLKNPLTSILIILDNLIDDPDMDKETREDFIRDIKREITNIHFLVQSILKLSKFDSNTVHFIQEKGYLKDLIEESIKNVAPLCDLKNIKLNVRCDKKSMVFCDLKWQVEALTNIIKNCVEHSQVNGEIEITASENKVYSLVEIRDYAKGISKEDLPHIFERFYKGKNATKDSIGIGLALAKTIIESNNGMISVESSSKGTCFTIKYFHINGNL